MRNKIRLLILSISFLAGYHGHMIVVNAQETKDAQLQELDKLRLKNMILEVENINLQMRPMIQRRDDLVKNVNSIVDNLYKSKGLDRTKWGFDLNTLEFYEIIEKAK